MAIRKKETPVSAVHAVAAPQTGYLQQSALLCAASPTRSGSLELYRLLRERVPIIDAAIMKTVRLLGTFDVRCDDERAQTALRRFLKTVPVGSLRCGIDALLSTYFE